MFTPKWKKYAKQLYKGSLKFLNYKRDILPQDRIDEIQSRRQDLKAAMKRGDKEAAEEAGKLLDKTCEQALPKSQASTGLQENVEAIFVCVIIALAVRTYIVQPFRIPTNSMYPTLNGITAHELSKDDWPSAPVRLIQHATHGRNYFQLKTENECYIESITPTTKFHFFPRVVVTFSDGTSQSFSGSENSIYQGGLVTLFDKLYAEQRPNNWKALQSKKNFSRRLSDYRASLSQFIIPANTIIAEGYSQSGDLILVNRMAYHFRKPDVGEVFVFDTRDLNIKDKTEETYYIKRLAGTPGDSIKLIPSEPLPQHSLAGDLMRNGSLAKEPGFLRVQSKQDGYKGYSIQNSMKYETKMKDLPSSGLSEYWAMGDNSYSSSDSRTWGTVKEYNVLGPAFLSLWPFGSGHWGSIK